VRSFRKKCCCRSIASCPSDHGFGSGMIRSLEIESGRIIPSVGDWFSSRSLVRQHKQCARSGSTMSFLACQPFRVDNSEIILIPSCLRWWLSRRVSLVAFTTVKSTHWYFLNRWCLGSNRQGTGNILSHSPSVVIAAVQEDSIPESSGTGYVLTTMRARFTIPDDRPDVTNQIHSAPFLQEQGISGADDIREDQSQCT
jgi:hypothetical protein